MKTPKEQADDMISSIPYRIALKTVDDILISADKNKIMYRDFTENSINEYTEFYYWQKVKEEVETFNIKNK